MIRKIIKALWIFLAVIVLAIVIVFVSISKGWIGYMPPVEELENPSYKFATEIFSEDEKVLGTWSYSKENANAFLKTTEIAVRLSIVANININDSTVNKLGKALKKHGFLRMAKNKTYVYAVKALDVDEVDRRAKEKEQPPKDTSEVAKIPYRFEN
jgi:predicted DNA-binding transcriptional regulator